MRHNYFGRKLGRNHHQRQALFKSLTVALFRHGRIKTTQAKAKAVKPLIEKIITKAKKGTVASRRQILSSLNNNQEIVKKLFSEIIPGLADRQSGFTRIINLSAREGDLAPLVILELVDKPKVLKKEGISEKNLKLDKPETKKKK